MTYGGIRHEPTDTALDIAELLHSHVRAKATLCEDIPNAIGAITLISASKLERDTVSKDGGVAVGNICERSCVYEDWCALWSSHRSEASK